MLDAGLTAIVRVAAGLQDVIKTDDVGLNVGIGVGDGIADTSLGRQIYHHLGLITGKHIANQCSISNITRNEFKTGFRMQGGFLLDLLQTPVLDGHIVIIRAVVHGHDGDGGDVPQQLQNQIGPDKANAAGDKDGFVG